MTPSLFEKSGKMFKGKRVTVSVTRQSGRLVSGFCRGKFAEPQTQFQAVNETFC